MTGTDSPLVIAVEEAARLVYESTRFQARVGAADAAAAAAKVFLFELEVDDPIDLEKLRPFALVYPSRVRWTKEACGDGGAFDGSGEIVVQLTDVARFPGRGREARVVSALDFAQWAGEVMQDVAAAAGHSDRLQAIEIVQGEETGGFYRSPTKDEKATGSYWWAEFRIRWGRAG